MSDYVIKGRIKDSNGKPVKDVKVQAMDNDQELFDDRNDDILGIIPVNPDGTFEIPFDKNQFEGGLLEGNPDIYLIIRNSKGEIIHKTEVRRGVKPSDITNLTFDVILDSQEKTVKPPDDPYSQNLDRTIAAFMKLGETAEWANDGQRTFTLLMSSINAYALYTNERMWDTIEYDGPQVNRYPWRTNHSPHPKLWKK